MHYSQDRMDKIKKTNLKKKKQTWGQDVKQLKIVYITGDTVKLLNHFENCLAVSHEFKYTSTLLPTNLIPWELKIYVHKKDL